MNQAIHEETVQALRPFRLENMIFYVDCSANRESRQMYWCDVRGIIARARLFLGKSENKHGWQPLCFSDHDPFLKFSTRHLIYLHKTSFPVRVPGRLLACVTRQNAEVGIAEVVSEMNRA